MLPSRADPFGKSQAGCAGLGAYAIPPYRKPPKTDIAFIGRFASKSALAILYDKDKIFVQIEGRLT